VNDGPIVARSDALALPRALALNRFAVSCPGVHKLTRLLRPESKDARRALETRLGKTIFVSGNDAYASGETQEGTLVELSCDFDVLIHQSVRRWRARRGCVDFTHGSLGVASCKSPVSREVRRLPESKYSDASACG
jgi:hypothetical protein